MVPTIAIAIVLVVFIDISKMPYHAEVMAGNCAITLKEIQVSKWYNFVGYLEIYSYAVQLRDEISVKTCRLEKEDF